MTSAGSIRSVPGAQSQHDLACLISSVLPPVLLRSSFPVGSSVLGLNGRPSFGNVQENVHFYSSTSGATRQMMLEPPNLAATATILPVNAGGRDCLWNSQHNIACQCSRQGSPLEQPTKAGFPIRTVWTVTVHCCCAACTASRCLVAAHVLQLVY